MRFLRVLGGGLAATALRVAAFVAAFVASSALAQTQAILPSGMTQFADGNGAPYAGGRVYMYVPYTTTPKVTFQDPNGVSLNQNPITLDANGRAVIWGNGEYRQVLQDAFGVVVWDQLTYASPATAASSPGPIWFGTAQGTSNAITLSGSLAFVGGDGQEVGFLASATNTGSTTINASGFGSVLVEKNSVSGLTPLTGGEVVPGNLYYATYSSGFNAFILQGLLPPQQIPSGAIMMFATSAGCPTGFLQNNGAAISRSANAGLFGAIGTTFGAGDGSTTFNVPGDQGYFWRSWNNTGVGPDVGRVFGSGQGDAVATTTGTITSGTASGSISGSTSSVYLNVTSGGSGLSEGSNVSAGDAPVTGTFSGTIAGNVSVGSGSDTRPLNIAYLSCIKL